MYNERKETFSVRDVVLQLLFILLFVFILLWLFPTKKFVTDSISPLYETRFNENVNAMKEAAQSYFTTPRLPKKVGDKVTLTLGEMLDKKIILPFLDSNNKQCDLNDSYVEITKMDDEYILKVNLDCTDKTDYVLVYMGCYNYCETDICEKKEEEPVKPAPQTPTTNKPTPSKPATPTYLYEYEKVTDSYWGNWSEWSTTEVKANSTRQVETKQETETTTVRGIIGYNVTKKKEPIYEYVETFLRNDTIKICENYETVYTTVSSTSTGSHWRYAGKVTLDYIPTDTSTKKWVYIPGTLKYTDCGNCSSGFTIQFDYYENVQNEVEVQQGVYKCTKFGTKTIKAYYFEIKDTGKTKTIENREPVYGDIKQKKTVTYYRYRTLQPGTTIKKWSYYNDTSLLSEGYKYTGNKVTK